MPAKILGRQLFFDNRLSSNGKLSCASCHVPDLAFTDGKVTAQGLAPGIRNTPTLINVAMNRWFFYDGRADSLWMQVIGPMESRTEMGGNWPKIYNLLLADKNLFGAYNAVFTEYSLEQDTPYFKIDSNRFKSNIAKAIAAFQMDIIQFDTQFDRFVADIKQGKTSSSALTEREQHGLKLFIGKGQCVQCHSGANLSDGEFHNIRLSSTVTHPHEQGRFGAIEPLKNDPLNTLGQYSDDRTQAKTRYLRQEEGQWAAYKTPTLRNIEFTGPYMHDGSMATLREVITHYSDFKNAAPNHHNSALLTPRNLSDEEIDDMELFLKTLSSKVSLPTY